MKPSDCDFSPLKDELRTRLSGIRDELDRLVATLDREEACLLNEIEHISKTLAGTRTLASTYYLNCFLAPFTSKYREIAASIQRLSARRQGALIVIEREQPVAPWMTPGIPLAAEVTSSLLESIFVPGSPLHDGAVYIRSDRIVSAANILPLTENVYADTDARIGTRHRAAIGLSERSDALILVVSEESGRTSFCLNGRLYPFAAA